MGQIKSILWIGFGLLWLAAPTWGQTAVDQGTYSDTLLIGSDTLYLSPADDQSGTNLRPCKGQLQGVNAFFIGKTQSESAYSYVIGTKTADTENANQLVQLTVLLLHQDAIVSLLDLAYYFSPAYQSYLYPVTLFQANSFDEVVEVNMNQAFCGGFAGSVFLVRKERQLLQGPTISQTGEPGMEYHYQELVRPAKGSAGELWIKTSVGIDDIEYFQEIERYQLQSDSIVLLNPKTPDTYYVTAPNGLWQRAEPSAQGPTLGLLPYGTPVRVLNKTVFEDSFQNYGQTLTGSWVQLEYIGPPYYDHSIFVFDGYLSKSKPD